MLRVSRTLALAAAGGIVLAGGTAGVTLAVTTGSWRSPAAPVASGPGGVTSAPAVPKTAGGLTSPAVPALASSASGSYAPGWCCSTANAPGLTTTGQGSAYGSGPGARAEAIAKAIADAASQARAAAAAAGITLGRITGIEVSTPFYAIPVESSPPAASGSPGNSGSQSQAPATPAPPIPKPSTTICPAVPGCSYQASITASVTVTWAIG